MNALRGAVVCWDFDAGEGGLLDEVGGHDGLGELGEFLLSRADGFGEFGKFGYEFFCRERNADDAGRAWEGLLGRACEDAGCGETGFFGSVIAGLASGAVGIAGVDEDDAYLAAS